MTIEARRGYVGCSSIGRPCLRSIWYSYRWASEQRPSGAEALYGHAAEESISKWLLGKGWKIHKEQVALAEPILGILRGHADAIGECNGVIYIIDYKTVAAKYLKEFKRRGLKAWREEYYYQLQCYMGLSGIKTAILMAFERPEVEKEPGVKEFLPIDFDNPEARHYEVVQFNPDDFAKMKGRALDVHEAVKPMGKQESPMCAYTCDHYKVCNNEVIAEVNCRTCGNLSPWMDCALGHECNADECGSHVYNPHLLTEHFIPIKFHAELNAMEYNTLVNTSNDDCDIDNKWIMNSKMIHDTFRNGGIEWFRRKLKEKA